MASGNDANRRREMRSFFEDCLVSYEKDRRQKGLPIKDVAMAVGFFIGVSYNVYHGGNAVSAAGGEALRAQVRQVLVEDEDFGKLPDAEKQRIYETMAVMGEFIAISASVGESAGNNELKAMARDMAKDNLERLLGIPVSKVRITDSGIAL